MFTKRRSTEEGCAPLRLDARRARSHGYRPIAFCSSCSWLCLCCPTKMSRILVWFWLSYVLSRDVLFPWILFLGAVRSRPSERSSALDKQPRATFLFRETTRATCRVVAPVSPPWAEEIHRYFSHISFVENRSPARVGSVGDPNVDRLLTRCHGRRDLSITGVGDELRGQGRSHPLGGAESEAVGGVVPQVCRGENNGEHPRLLFSSFSH